MKACPRRGCRSECESGSVCCARCWALIPAAIAVDLEAAIAAGVAWTSCPLWMRAHGAAVAALERTRVLATDQLASSRLAIASRRRA